MPVGMNEGNAMQMPKSSFAVDKMREEYESGESTNAEDHGRQLAMHIQAIDEEVDALRNERGRLADSLIKVTEVMMKSAEEFRAVVEGGYERGSNKPSGY